MAGRRIWLAARNQVELVGRLAAPAEERVLPSGDRIATFRLVVDRPEGDAAGGRSRQRVDTLDCVAWAAAVRHRSLAWAAGDVIDLAGALRRRFRRTDAGPVSRVEVEVRRARRARQAGS